MLLSEILEKIVKDGEQFFLCDGPQAWNAGDLLNSLSVARLRTRAYLQPGLYIAEISEAGYLGRVLFTIKAKSA